MADKPSKGLADVVAASTALSDIDGQAGRLAALHLKHIIETGEDLEKDLVTPSLEQLRRWDAELYAGAAA